MVHEYFIECSKHETGHKKIQLQMLAIGHGGLIINRDDDHFLIVPGGEFKIPTIFSIESYKSLVKLLWPSKQFLALETVIKNAKLQWCNVRKREKILLIDQYIVNMKLPIDAARKLKSLIIFTLLLKPIQSQAITYDGEKISSINISEDYFHDLTI